MYDPQQEYQRQAIKNASPTELITKLYDFAVQACYQKDEGKLQKVLVTLTESLNFEFKISENLYNLYKYCQQQAVDKKFEEVRELLEPVREAWIDEVQNSSKRSANLDGKGFIV